MPGDRAGAAGTAIAGSTAGAGTKARPPYAHPELFLPHEVFRSLMTLAFPSLERNGERFRKGLLPEVKRLGLPAEFWERLRAMSAVHLSDTWEEEDLGRSRADALAAAREALGTERFDRLLYEVIAVNKFHSEDRLPAPEVLRWTEAGCR